MKQKHQQEIKLEQVIKIIKDKVHTNFIDITDDILEIIKQRKNVK